MVCVLLLRLLDWFVCLVLMLFGLIELSGVFLLCLIACFGGLVVVLLLIVCCIMVLVRVWLLGDFAWWFAVVYFWFACWLLFWWWIFGNVHVFRVGIRQFVGWSALSFSLIVLLYCGICMHNLRPIVIIISTWCFRVRLLSLLVVAWWFGCLCC